MTIQTYRNGIGDISAPDYSYWDNGVNEKDNKFYIMLAYIWMIWLGNQFFILIIMLNFLIAVISQTYDQVMSQSQILLYKRKADLNHECRIIKKFIQDKGCLKYFCG